jgi:hypothetical protein
LYVDFPIKTRPEKGQPRLLLTSVDVQDYSSAVVFDSYEKLYPAFQEDDNCLQENENENVKGLEKQYGNGRWFSEYGTIENPHVLFYDGIGVEQVLASALGKYSLNHPTMEDSITRSKRELWDGGYLSNTPLRELLNSHRKYWRKCLQLEHKREISDQLVQIPELEVYVINLHPSTAKNIPTDKDLIDNRENDILFHDRTAGDELVAYLRTDYVDLTWKLVELAKSNGLSDDVEKILKMEAKSIARIGGEFRSATYRDIIDGRTNIAKIWRIDRRESSEATFGKTTDFTPTSVRTLIFDGIVDARISLNRMKILFAMEELISEGKISVKNAEEAMARIRKMVTVEELYQKSNAEITQAFERFVEATERLIPATAQRCAIMEHAKDILEFLLDVDSAANVPRDNAVINRLWSMSS